MSNYGEGLKLVMTGVGIPGILLLLQQQVRNLKELKMRKMHLDHKRLLATGARFAGVIRSRTCAIGHPTIATTLQRNGRSTWTSRLSDGIWGPDVAFLAIGISILPIFDPQHSFWALFFKTDDSRTALAVVTTFVLIMFWLGLEYGSALHTRHHPRPLGTRAKRERYSINLAGAAFLLVAISFSLTEPFSNAVLSLFGR